VLIKHVALVGAGQHAVLPLSTVPSPQWQGAQGCSGPPPFPVSSGLPHCARCSPLGAAEDGRPAVAAQRKSVHAAAGQGDAGVRCEAKEPRTWGSQQAVGATYEYLSNAPSRACRCIHAAPMPSQLRMAKHPELLARAAAAAPCSPCHAGPEPRSVAERPSRAAGWRAAVGGRGRGRQACGKVSMEQVGV